MTNTKKKTKTRSKSTSSTGRKKTTTTNDNSAFLWKALVVTSFLLAVSVGFNIASSKNPDSLSASLVEGAESGAKKGIALEQKGSGSELVAQEAESIDIDQAKQKALDFINNSLMAEGTEAKVVSIEDAGNLYALTVDLGSGQEVESFISKDGENFFPQVMNIEETTKQIAEAKEGQEAASAPEADPAEVAKSDDPTVELFVMSHCPFGTQIEKGFLPVIETIGEEIDYEIKFVDYAMHDKKEIDEQLRQYCIQEEQNEKFVPYLKCFLEDDQFERCLEEVAVDRAALDACVEATDQEFKITELYNDKSTWSNGRFPQFNVHKAENEKYGVQGSPTLVINGEKVSSGRSPQALLDTICGAFNEAPEACNTELDTANPSAGFGYGTAPANTAASCG